MRDQAILALEDGTVFHGLSIGVKGVVTGEVVFNTSISGYQEILTDPSYFNQIITFTYPHIGNVGVNIDDYESEKIYSSGLIIRDLPTLSSNWRSTSSLSDFLVRHNTVGISDIDTRKLTRVIRSKGALRGCIIAGKKIEPQEGIRLSKSASSLKGMDLAKEVTTKHIYEFKKNSYLFDNNIKKENLHIVAIDFGVKKNILRLLFDKVTRVTVVPAKTSFSEIASLSPDGIFLSNGPGDPEPCDYAIKTIKDALSENVPIFGICLGHQLLCLACGAKTNKMKFGHHGANHPVIDLKSKKVFITSQNHGFTVDPESLGKNIEITHLSLFDNTIQGIQVANTQSFSFQGHPEASPGPKDIEALFSKFINNITNKNNNLK
ncbi:MAG: carbamoyl-phosphate synthase small subunit [Gammaproteobacteria bacterium TMED78]|nr:MAG: carbamoyl-phosphate synthase small subunit [Gammaproteobacteria bacterium TMED78]